MWCYGVCLPYLPYLFPFFSFSFSRHHFDDAMRVMLSSHSLILIESQLKKLCFEEEDEVTFVFESRRFLVFVLFFNLFTH